MAACSQKNPDIICYEVSSSEDEVPLRYQLHKVFQKGNIRFDSIFNYDINYQLYSQYVNTYEVNEFGLNKLMESYTDTLMLPFLSRATRDCITFSYDDPALDPVLETEYCYLGTEDVKIGEKIYKNTHKFKETEVFSGLVSWVYFDEKFIMVKQTYDSEFKPNIEIEISESCRFLD